MTLINKDICKAVSEFERRQIRNSRWPGYHGCHVFFFYQITYSINWEIPYTLWRLHAISSKYWMRNWFTHFTLFLVNNAFNSTLNWEKNSLGNGVFTVFWSGILIIVQFFISTYVVAVGIESTLLNMAD